MYSQVIITDLVSRESTRIAPQEFTAYTQLPALVSVKRCGTAYLAESDKTKDFNGFLFVRVTFADGERMWTSADNVRVVPTVSFDDLMIVDGYCPEADRNFKATTAKYEVAR